MRETQETTDTRRAEARCAHAKELKAVSDLLDTHPTIGEMVAQDIGSEGGRHRMTGDRVFRVLFLKQLNEFSFDELAFHLADPQTYRRFCDFGLIDPIPQRSTLAENLKRIKAETALSGTTAENAHGWVE